VFVTVLPLSYFAVQPDAATLALVRAVALSVPLDSAAQAVAVAAAAGQTDRGIARLLALVPQVANAECLPPTTITVCQQIRRQTAARFAVFEQMAQRIAVRFAQQGIPLLLLKGFALALEVYPSVTHRPIGDLDLATPAQDHAAAADCLLALGFVLMLRDGEPKKIHAGVTSHAQEYHHPTARLTVDLHALIVNCSLWPGADQAFWQHAVALERPGFSGTLTLAPEHHLVHACLHGYYPSPLQSSVRWMVDAQRILGRYGDGFRWSLVEDEGQRQRCGPLLAAALTFLHRELECPIPPSVVARLAAQPFPFYDREYFRLLGRSHQKRPWWIRLLSQWYGCQRRMGRSLYSPWRFLEALQVQWGEDSLCSTLISFWRRRSEPEWLKRKRARTSQGGSP
jgi:hypothetical protein